MHSLAQATLTTWISFLQVHSVNNAYKHSLLLLPLYQLFRAVEWLGYWSSQSKMNSQNPQSKTS